MSLAISASLASAGLIMSACGGGEDPVVNAGAQEEATTTSSDAETTVAPTTQAPTESAAETTQAPTEAPATSEVPDVDVINVSTGDTTNLRSIAGTGTPVALWFWFPH